MPRLALPGTTWTQVREMAEAGELPEGCRYEVLRGDLVIQGSPSLRHQRITLWLARALAAWADERGGEVLLGPAAVSLDEANTVQPDVTYVRREDVAANLDDRVIRPPGLVVEVSSPGTKSLDLNEKRDLLAALGAAEYWVVDLDTDEVVVHRAATGGGFARPERVGRGGSLAPVALPGLAIAVADLLDAGEPPTG